MTPPNTRPPTETTSLPHADDDDAWPAVERRARPAPQPVADVRLTHETIEYLEAKMAQAVRDGIKGAMTEDTAAAFWGAGLQLLQKNAAQKAGTFVLGSLWSLMQRAALFLLLGGLVYSLGGWSALAALFKTVFGSGQ